MIKNRLKILLAERDLNYSKLTKVTDISVNTLSKMGKNRGTGTKQITYDVSRRLCIAPDCTAGDLLSIFRKKIGLVA